MKPKKYYELEIESLNGELAYEYQSVNGKIRVSKFWDENTILTQEVPEESINYYKFCFERDKQPLIYLGIPQLLLKGELKVGNLKIITI